MTAAVRWYYIEGGAGPARAFRAAVARQLRLLVEHPHIGTLREDGLRVWPVGRFSYSLLYQITTGGIRVVTLTHQKRGPDYWQRP